MLYPSLQLHSYDPGMFVHTALAEQFAMPSSHSSLSVSKAHLSHSHHQNKFVLFSAVFLSP